MGGGRLSKGTSDDEGGFMLLILSQCFPDSASTSARINKSWKVGYNIRAPIGTPHFTVKDKTTQGFLRFLNSAFGNSLQYTRRSYAHLRAVLVLCCLACDCCK